MPTQIYKTKAGIRVPGVTTVLANLGWNKRQLMHWANKLGLEGTELNSPKAKEAADVGTLAHALGEQWLKGGCSVLPLEPEDKSSLDHQAWLAFQSLPAWWAQQSLTVVGTEVSLVSEVHGYGGTMDLVAQDREGQLHVIDFKTGKDVYTEMLLQLAAYGRLWQEHHPEYPKAPAYALLRWGREGDFHHHAYPQLHKGWEAFQHALALHELHKQLTK